MQSSSSQLQKPSALRVIFILNALMTILPFIFYIVFTANNISIGKLDPMWMVYTGIAYIISFAVLVYFLNNRKLAGTRIMLIVNILIAIPASAYIGMLIAGTSLALAFFNKKVLTYFSS